MGRDWRILPLLGWFLVTLILVSIQVPLWPRHAIVLIPPLIGLVALSLKNLPAITLRGPITWTRAATVLMGLLVLAVVVSDVRREYHRYKSLQSARSTMPWTEEVAADLARLTTPDQWTVTNAQFVAALSKRDTPPWLVDTSFTRISSGYLTLNELIQAASDPRVRAVVFATDHFFSFSPLRLFILGSKNTLIWRGHTAPASSCGPDNWQAAGLLKAGLWLHSCHYPKMPNKRIFPRARRHDDIE